MQCLSVAAPSNLYWVETGCAQDSKPGGKGKGKDAKG